MTQAIGSLLMGGSDFCPLYVSWANSFNQHYSYNCTNPSGLRTVSKFESFGDNSRCVQSTVSSFKMNLTETQCKEFYGCPNYPISFNVPLCMTVTCNTESEAVEITFGNETVTCSSDGQNIKLVDVPGASIRCPRLANICIE
jgi:Leishmanolysin